MITFLIDDTPCPEVTYNFWHILVNTVNFISTAVLDSIYFNPTENRLYQDTKNVTISITPASIAQHPCPHDILKLYKTPVQRVTLVIWDDGLAASGKADTDDEVKKL